MQCPNCGNQLAADATFCNNCGNKIESGGSYSFDSSILCPRCGNPLKSDARFCEACGYMLGGGAPEEVRVERKAPKEKDTGLIVLIVALVVIILACGITIALIFLNNGADDDGYDYSTGDKTVTSSGKSGTKKKQKEDVKTDTGTHGQDEEKTEVAVAEEPEPEPEETAYSSDYLFDSDTRYITESDLINLSREQIALIRNEIYARHGYVFQTEAYKEYFGAKSWYVPNPNFSEASFNAIEKYNKDLIVEYEKKMGWR